MSRLLFCAVETGFAAVFLIPLFVYLHRRKFHSRKTTLTALLFALYLCAVYAVAGLPNVTYVRFQPNVNLIPFRYLLTDATSWLNVLLFVPLGFLLPLLRSRFRAFGPTLVFGLCLSALIEVFQIFTFRATDINDLMTNTLGTVLGYFPGYFLYSRFPMLHLHEENRQLRIICCSVLAVMFFFQPLLAGFVRSLNL